MALRARRPRYGLLDYLAIEESSNVRHEFLDGEIFAMAGGTPEHGRVCANVIGLLWGQLGGRPCSVFTSDVRVRVRARNVITYPDASVVCGPVERDSEDRQAVLNPLVLIEVGSPSTEAYDRGEKLEVYKLIPSLREVVLVSCQDRRVEVWRRGDAGWSREAAGPGEVARLASVDCELPVDAVYREPAAE